MGTRLRRRRSPRRPRPRHDARRTGGWIEARTEGRVFEYSRLILRKMISHNEAQRPVVAGIEGLRLLNRILDCRWSNDDIRDAGEGRSGTYQWRTMTLRMERPQASGAGEPASIQVIQVPHF